MFISFFYDLKEARIPVTLREYLTLLEALAQGVTDYDVTQFYYLARTSLVKDEKYYDRFDRVFAHIFEGVEALNLSLDSQEFPEDWLSKLAEKHLTEEEKAEIEAMGGFEKLMETLQKRMAEQEKRHQGGNKWIGTAGTSPFGAYGYNPEGVRIGQKESRHRRAVKVWDQRDFKNLDDQVEIGTRNIKVALRRLRHFIRAGAEEELDLDHTITSTASNAGYLDIKMRPERHNAIKVLLFLDVGGSMDDHVRIVEELFSAARSEFKHLEYFYFHNCLYESVWRNNARRFQERTSTWDVLRTYPSDYKVIVVGDAAMSPYEVIAPGGSVEHWNEEAGQAWLQRLRDTYKHSIWINPMPEAHWRFTQSVGLISSVFEHQMYPLNLSGLERGMKALLQ